MASTKLRPLYLLDILRRETDEAHRLTVPQLADALAELGITAERKSLYRDIRGLIEHGADIRKSAAGYYLEGRGFTAREVNLLAEALWCAPFLSRRRTEDLLKRLAPLLSRYQAEDALAGALVGPKAADDEELLALEAVRAAISVPCQITFAWREGGTGCCPAPRLRASPYGLLLREGRCCLVCNLEGREDLSVLPLARICAVWRDATPWRPFAEVSPYGAAFGAEDYGGRLACFCAGKTLGLRLLCREDILDSLLERLEPETGPCRQEDGRFLLEARAAAGPELTAWLLSFGPGLEVLDPPALRQALRQSLRQAWALYEETPNE